MPKICSKCKQRKSKWKFAWRHDTAACRYRDSICKLCRSSISSAWSRANPEKRKAIEARLNAKPRYKAHRRRYMRRRYLRDRKRISALGRAWKARNPERVCAHAKKQQLRYRQELSGWYVRRLLRRAGVRITWKTIKDQRTKTRLWRIKPLLKTLAVGAVLSQSRRP